MGMGDGDGRMRALEEGRMLARSRVRSATSQRYIKVRYHLHPTVELIIVFCPAFVLYFPTAINHPSLLNFNCLAYSCVRGVNAQFKALRPARCKLPASVIGRGCVHCILRWSLCLSDLDYTVVVADL